MLVSLKSKKNTLGALILLALFAVGSPALAFEITYPVLPGDIALPEDPQLNEFVRYIYAFSIVISGFVAFGVAIFGGVLHLLSAGNPVKKAMAREWLGAGFWGVLILLLSYIILATINPQLVGLKEVAFEPTAVPPYDVTARTPLLEQKDVGFQIPVGKLIERAILEDKERFSINGREFKNDAEFRQAIKNNIQGIINLTQELNPDLFELKKLIDGCNDCGGSLCTGGCSPEGCTIPCDFSAIHAKADQIKNSPVLPALEEKEEELGKYRSEIKKRNEDLYKAVFLTTIFFDEVRDYFSFAIERETVERVPERTVEIETLPEWKDIKLSIKTADGRFIPDPATFYFWKRYQEMEDAIDFASGGIGADYMMSCPGISMPSGSICVPSQPGAMVWPAEGTVTRDYGKPGPRGAGRHAGIDIANSLGTPVVAAAKGKVISVNTGCVPGDSACGGRYGNWILIEHENFDPDIGTVYTMYAHLENVLTSPGSSVEQGQQIATMGWTGRVRPPNVNGTHLHFEVRKDAAGNNTIDPMTYLTGESICGPGGGGGGGSCEVITDLNNPCHPDNLRPYFGVKAEEASQICNAESGGNMWALNDGCTVGAYDYSVGLFQINLYRTGRCDLVGIPENQIFEEISPSTCRIKDRGLADECAKRYGWGDADLNAQKAVTISGGGTNWCPWSTACPLYCNLCGNWNSCP